MKVLLSEQQQPPHSTQPPRSAHHLVDLNFGTASQSSCSSSLNSTGTIPSQEFPIFITDPQSTWLPISAFALPASTEHLSLNPVDNPQQDFVLFDNPPPRQHHSRSLSAASSQRQHSCNKNNGNSNHRDTSRASAIQNHRVAQILQAKGHQPSSTAYSNRFPNHFYASSAPSSTVSLHQQSRLARPPVPLFHQKPGRSPQSDKMMNAADVDLEGLSFIPPQGSTPFSSPMMLSTGDLGSGSSTASQMGTISPQDLFIREPFMSAPNSAALTALTSPSLYNDSPELDGFDVSPSLDHSGLDRSSDPWFPLFPPDVSLGDAEVDHSPAEKSEDSPDCEASKRRSGGSPTTKPRHSTVSGVNARKRDKPLPPIVVEDSSDMVAMKRARNTLAARKSRERKAQRFDELEARIEELERERDHWKMIALSQSRMAQ